MPTRTSNTDDGQSSTVSDSFDRYSHVKTESGEIIYDTEHDSAWIQADSALLLDDWR